MTPGLEGKYYHYILRLKADGEKEKDVTMVPQDGVKPRMDSHLTGLRFNTYYAAVSGTQRRQGPWDSHGGHQVQDQLYR